VPLSNLDEVPLGRQAIIFKKETKRWFHDQDRQEHLPGWEIFRATALRANFHNCPKNPCEIWWVLCIVEFYVTTNLGWLAYSHYKIKISRHQRRAFARFIIFHSNGIKEVVADR